MTQYAWLIPVLPFAAFLVISFLTKKFRQLSSTVSILAVLASFVISVGILLEQLANPVVTESAVKWIKIGKFMAEMGTLIDPLNAVMLIVVTLVSLLVQVYSIGYMGEDPGYARYFSYLSLFTASMLGLVVANNLLQLYIFYELVGLCSYLLIGFWYHKKEAADAAKKAFVTTRIGDFGFLIGVLVLLGVFGTLNFGELGKAIAQPGVSVALLSTTALLIFSGAVGKSAQFPLHVWLPDAMEGPTPVSALIHAATMVAAGVFLVARMYFLFAAAASPLTVVAYIGGFTAIFAATIAVAQNDIKRILAYSTLSQLGYMIMALGVGGYTAGVFHLMTHAFFKALLFLGAGSVIFSFHHKQDIWEMGGLYKPMKITAITMIIASLSIAGIYPLSGFWSKDEILLAAYNYWQAGNSPILFFTAMFVAFLTAFYMFRLCFVVFFGKAAASENAGEHVNLTMFSKGHGHNAVHESPLVMTLPLMILALLAIFAGFWGSPMVQHGFGSFVRFGEGHEGAGINMGIALSSTVLALLGIGTAWLLYGRRTSRQDVLVRALGPVHTLLKNKYYVDEFYGWLERKVYDGVAAVLNWVDRNMVDGAVNGSAFATGWLGNVLRRVQTGQVQTYAMFFFGAVVVIILILAWNDPSFTAILGGAR